MSTPGGADSKGEDRAAVDRFLATRRETDFLELYRRHSAVVYALAVRLVGRADADDVSQEAWVRAIAGLEMFRWSSSFRTWLCGITVHCCHEVWRRQKPLADVSSPADTPAAGAVETGLDVERALLRLPTGYRTVVVLHDVYGFTHAEIAAMQGIDAGTSKSQLARGRTALRQLLGTASAGCE